MKNYYAGIGSRETPKDFQTLFTAVAKYLEAKGFTLRSGHAQGADYAFESGTKNCESYVPWYGFNGSKSQLLPSPKSFEIAEKYHSNWSCLKQGGQKLMARNVHQVLGLDLKTPSLFIICWTHNGSGSGGTGQALRIAKDYKIPIFDCGRYSSAVEAFPHLKKFVNSFINKENIK